MNIFERASRRKLRFPSTKGILLTEQLWDLPLTASGKTSLDSLAQSIHRELSAKSVSFVDTKLDEGKTELELQLEILKHIIQSKQKDKAAAEERIAQNERRRKLYAALEAKEESELAGKTRAELEAEIARLG